MEINDEIKAYLTLKFAEEIDESPEGLDLSYEDIFDMLYDNMVYYEEDADDDFVLLVSAVSEIGGRYVVIPDEDAFRMNILYEDGQLLPPLLIV